VPSPDAASYAVGDVIAIDKDNPRDWSVACRAGGVFLGAPPPATTGASLSENMKGLQSLEVKAGVGLMSVVDADLNLKNQVRARVVFTDSLVTRISVSDSTIYPDQECRRRIMEFRGSGAKLGIVESTVTASMCKSFESTLQGAISVETLQALRSVAHAELSFSGSDQRIASTCGQQLVWGVQMRSDIPLVPAVDQLSQQEYVVKGGSVVECDIVGDADPHQGWRRAQFVRERDQIRFFETGWRNDECKTEGKGWAMELGSCSTGRGTKLKACRTVRVLPDGERKWSAQSY
jgi:hypothetical protein